MTETLPAQQRRREVLEETISLLDLAIRRSQASTIADPELKALIRGALEAARQELTHLKNATGAEDRPGAYRKAVKGPAGKGERREVAGPLG